MRAILIGAMGLLWSTSSSYAATILTGDAFISGPTPNSGGILGAGLGGNVGDAFINGGSVVDLDANTLGDRPQAIVGEGGGTGTVTVTGSGSQLSLNGASDGAKINVGLAGGSGLLSILNGGSVELTDPSLAPFGRNVVVQVGEDATGSVALDFGQLSLLSSGDTDLSIGEIGGDASLVASNGSVVELRSDAGNAGLRLADGTAGSSGSLSFSNSDLNISSANGNVNFDVAGSNGLGTATFGGASTDVTLAAGGATNGNIQVRVGGGNGTGTLDLLAGASMSLFGDVRANLRFGNGPTGNGTLNVTGGSTLVLSGADRSGLFFAGVPGATGTGFIEGSTVTLNAGIKTEMGLADDGGTASLTIDNSSVSLESAEDTAIFAGVGPGNGSLTVTNNSVLNLSTTNASLSFAQIYAGADFKGPGATGTIAVDGGSTVNIASAYGSRLRIGEEGTTGTATISGAGTSVNLTSGAADFSFLRVGRGAGSTGTLLIEDGATVTLSGDQTRFLVGREGDALGIATLTNGGTLSAGGPDGVVAVGDDAPGAGDAATGILTITGTGSKVSAGSRVTIGALTGTGTTSGLVTVANGGVLEAPDVFIGAGGVLAGDGTLLANVSLGSGGILAPGLSPGELVIDGDLILDGGTLDLEIGGTSPGLFDTVTADRILVGGAFDMMVSFVGGYVPEVGDTVSFLRAGSFVGDVFSKANLIFDNGFEGNLFFDTDGNVSLGVTMSAPSVIPVPAPALLLLGALGLLGALRAAPRSRLCSSGA